jgi:hypothetical protein
MARRSKYEGTGHLGTTKFEGPWVGALSGRVIGDIAVSVSGTWWNYPQTWSDPGDRGCEMSDFTVTDYTVYTNEEDGDIVLPTPNSPDVLADVRALAEAQLEDFNMQELDHDERESD